MIELLLLIFRLALFLLIFLVLYIIITAYRIISSPKSFPSRFLKRKIKQDAPKKRIVIIGDSITHGTVTSNYIKPLEKKLKRTQFQIINAGLNADLTINILMRMDDIIKCRPDIAIVLIGTNDAIGSFRVEDRASYVRFKKAPEDPEFWTLERFKEDFIKIITKLKNETDATIGVLSIPTMGEDLMDPVLDCSKAYSQVIKGVSKDLGAYYMPLNEEMVLYLNSNPSHQKYSYEKHGSLMWKSILAHYFGRGWQKIAEKHGFHLLTDHIHLSTKGARIVCEFIGQFIDDNTCFFPTYYF